jgi:hypothetical protein
VLFLIPVPWVGPVLAPAFVSIALVGGALLLLRRAARGQVDHLPLPAQLLLLAGVVLVLGSFVLDFRLAISQAEPPPFRWGLFVAGASLGVAALAVALRTRS